MQPRDETAKIDALIQASLGAFTKRHVDEQQPLFGAGGALESIQFVSFLISLEQQIKSQFGRNIRMVSDKAFSAKNSPFRNILSLRDWILTSLNEKSE